MVVNVALNLALVRVMGYRGLALGMAERLDTADHVVEQLLRAQPGEPADPAMTTTELHRSVDIEQPGIGPEHSWLADIGRVKYVAATDKEALSRGLSFKVTMGDVLQLTPTRLLGWLCLAVVLVRPVDGEGLRALGQPHRRARRDAPRTRSTSRASQDGTAMPTACSHSEFR